VVGYDYSPGNNQWRIEKRSLTDGSLVPGFGTGGAVTSNPSTGLDVARSIAVDPTAMYVIGYDYSPENDQWRIEKRTLADGSLVPEFGAGGVVTVNPSTSNDAAFSIAIDSTAMYVVGYDSSSGDWQWRIEKRGLADGSLVPGFGTGGVVTSDPTTYADVAYSIAIDSTAMCVVGYDYSPGNEQWRIEKRNLTDGSPVPGFGTGGVVTGNPSTDADLAYSIAIDSTAMYVAGYDSSPGNEQWRIEKRSLADGSLAPGFGPADGVATSDPSTDYDAAYSMTVDSTAMYVVGWDSSPGNEQWRIEKRSLADGSLVTGFSTGGVVTVNPSTGDDRAYGIAIDSTAMYVVGYDDSPGNWQWRIEKRSLTDGSLVGAFTNNPSTGDDRAYGIAIDSTAMYVIGWDHSPGNDQCRIEKRSLADGSLVPAFGTGGVVTNNPSTGYDRAYGIAIDSTAMYVVGYDESPVNGQWRIEKRSLADGSLVTAFGTGGVVTSDPSTDYDVARSITIDSTAMYVVGHDCSPGNQQWRIEKRSLTDGSLVAGFGTDGAVTSNPSTSNEQASGIAIDSTAMYVVGYDWSPGNGQWRIEKRVK
jgi:predicted RNA-binding protein with PUA domain